MSSIISIWNERWFLSTNAKDIGTLYLIFALFSGLLGTAFSVLIRMELSGPGVQYIADNQLYNSIITAHALLMIFFMVKNIRLSKCDSHISNQTADIIISNDAYFVAQEIITTMLIIIIIMAINYLDIQRYL